ncbi:hypothetical protein [Streptomyces endophyticus]|uniref:Lipoprotein n=1 Tax=Streptomyces endophyticus TaxID=714166 RepID=A0ABU6FGU7_9ACTN|nr:hypothetical protein [Streptomyces endophyticus]MEB8342061.1 hypothetical protein [Streptomyces endophyticus]
MKRRPTLAGLTMLLVVALAACGGGTEKSASSHGGGGSADSQSIEQHDDKVTGVRDGVRHMSRRTTRATRPHLVKKCATDTRKVRHTKRSKGRTKTYYTTKKVRDCHKVRKGTEKYTRVLRAERWCVRLDAVGGKRGADDQWFRVNSTTYGRMQGVEDRAKVTIEPIRKGC